MKPDRAELSVYDFEDYRAFLDAWLHESRAGSARGLELDASEQARVEALVRSQHG